MRININLLPYREEKRKEKANKVYGGLFLILLLSAFVYYEIYGIYVNHVNNINQRIELLKSATAKVNLKIGDIKNLKNIEARLIKREKLINELEDKRNLSVTLMNKIPEITPNGIFLTYLHQQGQVININGYSQSNDNVASLMRNIEKSQVFDKPTLHIISSTKLGNESVKKFNLQMMIADSVKTVKDKK